MGSNTGIFGEFLGLEALAIPNLWTLGYWLALLCYTAIVAWHGYCGMAPLLWHGMAKPLPRGLGSRTTLAWPTTVQYGM